MKKIIYLFLLVCGSFVACKKDCKITPISQCKLLDANSEPIQTTDCNCPTGTSQFANTCEPKDDNAYYGYSNGCDQIFDTLKIYRPEISIVQGNDKGISLGNGNLSFVAANLVQGKTLFLP